MWKVGIHNGYWLGSGFDEVQNALRATARTGADVYEVNTGTILQMNSQELLNFASLAKDLGLSLSVNGGFSAKNDISSSDPSIRAEGITLAKRIISGMQLLNAVSWSGILYGCWKKVPDPSFPFTRKEKECIRAQSVSSLQTICSIAEQSGVTLCLEVVNRYEQFLCNTIAEGVSLARDVGSPACKVLADTYHMNIEENSIVDAIRLAADAGLLGEVHVGESNRRLPGIGKTHIDWDGIFGTLREVGYEGLITMEPFMVEGLGISCRICLWRDLTDGATPAQFIENGSCGVNFVRSFWR